MRYIIKGDKILLNGTYDPVREKDHVESGEFKGRVIVGGNPNGREADGSPLGVVFLTPNLVVHQGRVGCTWWPHVDIARLRPLKPCKRCETLLPNNFRHFSPKCIGERRSVKVTTDTCVTCTANAAAETLSKNYRFR